MWEWLRRQRAALICVVGAAVLRALCVWATHGDPVFRVPYLDSAFYHAWARSLAEGRGDFQGPYFLAPLYPHVLSWLYRAFGTDALVPRVFQSVLGVLDIILVLGIAGRLGGRTAALAAGALLALHGGLVFHEGLLVLEPLLTTLLLGAATAVLLPVRRPHLWAALAGLLLGLATLARGTALVAAPVVAVVLARGPQAWRRLACCAALWCLALAPTMVRNHRLGGGFVVTTNAGVNFYAGNFPGAKGRFRQPPGVQFFTSPDVLPTAAALPTAVAPRPLTLQAVAGTAAAADSKLWFARAWDWIRAQPGEFVLLVLRRAGLTLQGRDIAQIESFAFHQTRLAALRFFFVDFTWILPLAALGAWQARRNRAYGAGFVMGFVVAALLPCILFFVTARHRLPALPFLAVLAGYGLAQIFQLVTARRWSRLGIIALFLAAAASLTRVGAQPPRAAAGWESAQMAERVYALGDLDAAIRWQEAALAWLPQRLEVGVNLAWYHSERGRPEDLERAEHLLRALVQRTGARPQLLDALASVLAQQGRIVEARAAWIQALQLDPDYAPAREHLRALNGPAESATPPRSP